MRVLIATESWLPQVNGVTNSVLRVLEHLELRGHEAVVVAPGRQSADHYGPTSVVRLRAVGLPGYPEVKLSIAATPRFVDAIEEFQPDVIHIASPFVHGGYAAKAAARLGVPSVAIFQTDIAGFARHYLTKRSGAGTAERLAWRRVRAIHEQAALTLAPSTVAANDLTEHGVPRVAIWPRGVDAVRFSPGWRSDAVRAQLAPGGERIVGYVGRLAAEKQVADLAALADLPGAKIVIVGDGPMKPKLQAALPDATFLGFLAGESLSTALACLDVFVHPGSNETFCQAAQEALASGVPVVAVGAGGLLDLVTPSHTGWLYPRGDLEMMRTHVCDLVGDEFKRAAMGEAARASVLPRTWTGVGDALLEFYRLAITTPSPYGIDATRAGRRWRGSASTIRSSR